MSEESQDKSAVSTVTMEVAVALIILVLGAIVVWDSYRLGAGWGDDGPKSGYFPFYIGLLLCGASVVNLIQALRKGDRSDSFVGREELRLVLSMLIPSIVYVGVMMFMGIYFSSAVFIAAFMMWQGKFAAWKSILTALTVVVLLFLTFEIWFKIALYKGPIEAWLGY